MAINVKRKIWRSRQHHRDLDLILEHRYVVVITIVRARIRLQHRERHGEAGYTEARRSYATETDKPLHIHWIADRSAFMVTVMVKDAQLNNGSTGYKRRFQWKIRGADDT